MGGRQLGPDPRGSPTPKGQRKGILGAHPGRRKNRGLWNHRPKSILGRKWGQKEGWEPWEREAQRTSSPPARVGHPLGPAGPPHLSAGQRAPTDDSFFLQQVSSQLVKEKGWVAYFGDQRGGSGEAPHPQRNGHLRG